jgi:hypothetical protein
MSTYPRLSSGGDSHAAGRGRQRLKLGAIGYTNARHGVDADAVSVSAALSSLCLMAVEFVEALSGTVLKIRRTDLARQGNSEIIKFAAIAYASARHGIDADRGMTIEGLAMLCQAAIDYVESIPKEDPTKRPAMPHLQIGNGANGA